MSDRGGRPMFGVSIVLLLHTTWSILYQKEGVYFFISTSTSQDLKTRYFSRFLQNLGEYFSSQLLTYVILTQGPPLASPKPKMDKNLFLFRSSTKILSTTTSILPSVFPPKKVLYIKRKKKKKQSK